MRTDLLKHGIDVSSVAQRHSVLCTTHEKNFGTIRVEHFSGNWMDAEAKFAKDGWTGDGPHNSVCPACNKRFFAMKAS